MAKPPKSAPPALPSTPPAIETAIVVETPAIETPIVVETPVIETTHEAIKALLPETALLVKHVATGNTFTVSREYYETNKSILECL